MKLNYHLRKLLLVTLILICCLMSVQTPVAADDYRRRVILVVADCLTTDDLNTPGLNHLHSFFDKGSCALLNTSTAGAKNRPSVAATVSAGVAAMGTPQEVLVFGAGESYLGEDPLALFRARTGTGLGRGQLAVLDLPQLLRLNATEDIMATPGLLGTNLHQAGLSTAALGNADLPGLPQRSMAVIAMDRNGIIDHGDVSGDLLNGDRDKALGYITDYEALKQAFQKYIKSSDFMVIDLGDLARLEQSKPNLTDRVYYRERLRILKEYDSFLAWLEKSLDLDQSRLLFASLAPSPRSIEDRRLFGLIAVKGEGITSGLLTSPTTRRSGIVALIDIAPSICDYLGAPTARLTGRPWHTVDGYGNLETIQLIEKRTVLTNRLRPSLVKGYVVLHLVVLAVVILCLFIKPEAGKYLRPLLLGLLAIPLVWLLVCLYPIVDPYLYVLMCLALTVLIVFFSLRLSWKHSLDPPLVICLLTVAVLLVDTSVNGYLLRYSVLSYDPMSGARYYGIGNEYVGVLLGSVIMGAALLVERFSVRWWEPRLLMTAMFLLTAVIIGAPQCGSEFGGFLAGLAAFAYTFLRFFKIRLRFKGVLAGCGLILIICLGLFFLDFSRPPELRTHLGQLVTSVQSQGLGVFLGIVTRKLAMNLKLIKYTIWTKVLLGTFLALGVLCYRPVGIFKRVLLSYPSVAIGLEGSLVGTLLTLAFNDSGIVSAATAIIFPAVILFYLVLQQTTPFEQKELPKEG